MLYAGDYYLRSLIRHLVKIIHFLAMECLGRHRSLSTELTYISDLWNRVLYITHLLLLEKMKFSTAFVALSAAAAVNAHTSK